MIEVLVRPITVVPAGIVLDREIQLRATAVLAAGGATRKQPTNSGGECGSAMPGKCWKRRREAMPNEEINAAYRADSRLASLTVQAIVKERLTNVTFALYAIEHFFPDAYNPGDLVTMDDETLAKLARPTTGAKLRLLIRAYIALKEAYDSLRNEEAQ